MRAPKKRALKTTRRVRMRLDFVIEFDRDLAVLPIGGQALADRTVSAISRSLERSIGSKGALGIGGITWRLWLDRTTPPRARQQKAFATLMGAEGGR